MTSRRVKCHRRLHPAGAWEAWLRSTGRSAQRPHFVNAEIKGVQQDASSGLVVGGRRAVQGRIPPRMQLGPVGSVPSPHVVRAKDLTKVVARDGSTDCV